MLVDTMIFGMEFIFQRMWGVGKEQIINTLLFIFIIISWAACFNLLEPVRSGLSYKDGVSRETPIFILEGPHAPSLFKDPPPLLPLHTQLWESERLLLDELKIIEARVVYWLFNAQLNLSNM
jgi:hypothetical protein